MNNEPQNQTTEETEIEYHEGWHDGYEAGCDVSATRQIIAFIRAIADTPLLHFDIEATKLEAARLLQAHCQEQPDE